MLGSSGTCGIPDSPDTPGWSHSQILPSTLLLTLTKGPVRQDLGAGQGPSAGQAFGTKSQRFQLHQGDIYLLIHSANF